MRYRLSAGTGEVVEEGEGVVEFAGGALVVSPAALGAGQPLRIAPADVAEIAEPVPYTVRLVLTDGSTVDLSGLGAVRTQLLAQLGEARADGLADTLLLDGVGRPETFPGFVDDVETELRLYDDALVVLPVRGEPEKLPYPFLRAVGTDLSGYRIRLEATGRPALELHRLGRRTTEFVDLLTTRQRAAAGRTAAFLAALLPGLGPVALRAASDRLRDGLAAARAELDLIDPTIWSALTAAATIPERVDGLATLQRLGSTWIGFKQTVSVERPAQGVTGWREAAPVARGHGDAGGPDLPLWLGFAGPFQSYGPVLAYGMLGNHGFPGSGFGNQHHALPRADVRRGRLTPAGTDLDALAVSGERPTVLAFALCQAAPDRVVYEVLNDREHATYVYRAEDPAALNRALDLLGFRVEGIYAEAGSAGSRYRRAAERLPALRLLRDAYAGRVAHTDGWADRLAQQLSV